MRGTLLGLAAIAAVVVSLGLAMYRAHQEGEWQEQTPQVTGRVAGYDADEYVARVELPDREADVEVLEASDYPVGSAVLVWDDGSTARLVSEPYDPIGWTLGGIAAATITLVAGVRVVSLRRDVRRVLEEPQPTTRIGVLPLGVGETAIFDLHDAYAARPLLRQRVVMVGGVPLTEDDDRAEQDDADDLELDEWPPPIAPPEPATAYGRLVTGGVAALRLDDGTELVPIGRLESAADLTGSTSLASAAHGDAVFAEPAEDAPPVDNGLVLGARVGRLAVGLAELAAGLVVLPIMSAWDLVAFDTFWTGVRSLWQIFVVLAVGFSGFGAVFSSVHASPAGVTVVGVLRSTTVPWTCLAGASIEDRNLVLVTRRRDVVPYVTPMSWTSSRRADARAAEAAARLTARIRRERGGVPESVADSCLPQSRVRFAGWIFAGLCLAATLVSVVVSSP